MLIEAKEGHRPIVARKIGGPGRHNPTGKPTEKAMGPMELADDDFANGAHALSSASDMPSLGEKQDEQRQGNLCSRKIDHPQFWPDTPV